MRIRFFILLLLPSLVLAESAKIEIPEPPPPEEAPPNPGMTSTRPLSFTEQDPQDKAWRFYENRIVEVRLRVKPEWTVMEFKEAEDVGTISFTLSRLPLVTFAVIRAPLEGPFESYVSAETLTPLYPTIQKKASVTLASRKGVLIKGIAEDGRIDESHFSTHGKSLYRVSFSAPVESWADAEKEWVEIKRGLRWLN